MRLTAIILLFAGASFAQTMTEFGAAAAVGTVGGANGQNVSKGLTAVFGKINQQTVKAAGKEETRQPALELADGQPKADPSGVPLPPGNGSRRAAAPAGMPVAHLIVPQEALAPFTMADEVPVLAPPPEMSPDKFKTVSAGMSRTDLLRLGTPASKISMDEDGRAVEVYSYRDKDRRIGTVRVSNGAVTSIQ